MHPKHPAGPAFEGARAAPEAERQQRIAALSADERVEFRKLGQRQAQKETILRKTQEVQGREHLPQRMRQHLLQSMKLEFRPAAGLLLPRDELDLRKNIEDFIVGRSTLATRMLKHHLETARRKARSEIAREQNRDRGQMSRTHRDEREAFLVRCERQRAKGDQFSINARDIAQPGVSFQFREAAHDPSWKRAFERAARAEGERESERSRDYDRDVSKTR